MPRCTPHERLKIYLGETNIMSNELIQRARETYNIAQWSDGYFDINEQGRLQAFPDGSRERSSIDLIKLSEAIQKAGLTFPILVRFNDILRQRFQTLNNAFSKAIQDHDYKGQFTGVYPIKVNQQRHVVEELLHNNNHSKIGLESGSKPELLAVLALSNPRSVIVCNGYKDREYVRLALIAQKLGHRVYLILEKLSELELILQEAKNMGVEPVVGIRIRPASMGSGKWQNTGGAKSKFGFSAAQILNVIDQLKENNALSILQVIHFNLGSQIANIADIQRGMKECARYYAAMRDLGVPINIVDVGGGLAVDYEGTSSRGFCSMNYTIQEYANNIVYTLAEVCNEHDLPHPQIITESGRAMTAHHAMLITNAIAMEPVVNLETMETPTEESPQIVCDLWEGYQNLSERTAREAYHDACYWLQEAHTMFTLGVIDMFSRAQAEKIFYATCLKTRDYLKPSIRSHREMIDELNEKLADKVFCNFSLFQSLPDAWAIDQVFPILPLQDLNKPLTRRGILQDITCDSDGKISLYVCEQGLDSTLPLPEYNPKKPYLLGIFLVGAYQEILGDLHNLFGDTHSVHVELTPEGDYQIKQPLYGDTVESALRYVHFEPRDLLLSYSQQLVRAGFSAAEQKIYLAELENGLSGYTYFEDYGDD